MTTKLLVGSTNPGKMAEFDKLLQQLPLVLTTPQREGIELNVVENGDTFEDNAVIKARAYCEASGLLTLADDSGIEVDALDGRPGVLSARYGGPGLSDQERAQLLLGELNSVPWDQRSARFRCVIAVVWPNGRVETRDGVIEGLVACEPVGEGGFGYDPVFYLPELGATTAQLQPDVKNELSHRGQAARRIFALLAQESRRR